MLSAADAAIARRDPLLPDLALLLDPERLQASMERTLRRALERPVIVYLRYKRGQSCLASCRMEVEGLPVEFAVKHHRPDADKLGLVMERPAVAGPLGPGRFVLEGTTLVVSVFPNDGKLKKLAWLDSPDAIAAVARRVNGGDAGFAEIHTLHFNPERRFVGRLTIDGCNRATVRCYRRPDFEDARARTGVLLSQGPLRLARWLFEEQSSSVAVLEWLRGRSLEDIIAGQPGADARLRLAGAALAELHGQQPRALPRRTPSAEAAAIAALAHDLSELCPELERDARRLAVRIAERLSGVGDADVRPIHGDFYARQVVVDGETAGILDLDGAALGPAAVDFGRFRADLDSAAIRGRLAPADAEAAIDVLLDGYEGTSGRRPADLDVYSAAQLFYLTTHPFRRREAAWPDRTLALLERAGDVLERRRRSAAAQPARRPVDPFGAMNDPSFPFLREALDPSASGRRLSELPAFSARAVEVRHATVSRHKPGRRCLITYVVDSAAGPETLIGKVRARGPDAATDRLLKRLWGGDFSPRSADGICVPEPLGVVEDFRMTVQRAVPGAPLDRLLDGPSGRRLARRAAEAIAKLHLVPAATSRRHTAEDEISILQRHLSKLNDECPGLRDRLAALAGRCARLADGVAHDPVCGIHRDFYPGQLLADEDHVYLLDLDLYSEGHPAIDVGNFLAHIDEYGIRRFGDAGRLADRKRVFVDRYLKLSTRTSRHAIAACEALSLARLVALSRNFPDRRPHTEALLHLAEERAAQAAAGSAAGRREAPDPRPTEVARP